MPGKQQLAESITLDAITSDYECRLNLGRFVNRELSRAGVVALRDLLKSEAHPSRNPVTIIFQHLWYNTITTGYELRIWLHPANRPAEGPQFGLYQSGQTLFLRIEFDGHNQVLSTDFTADQLQDRLASYLVPITAEAVPGSGNR